MCIAAVLYTLSTSVLIFVEFPLVEYITILLFTHSAQYKMLPYNDSALGRLLIVIRTVAVFSPSRSDVCIILLPAQYNLEDIKSITKELGDCLLLDMMITCLLVSSNFILEMEMTRDFLLIQ